MTEKDFRQFAERVKHSGLTTKQALDKFVKAMMQGPKLKMVKEKIPKPDLPHGVIKQYRDGREKVTDGERRRRMMVIWHQNGGLCGICQVPVRLERAVPDHINPRGMGGGFIDDRSENLQPAHALCNLEKGSQRDFKKRGQP